MMDFSVVQDLDMQLLHVFNGSNNVWLDQAAMVLTSGFTWIPLYLVLILVVIRNNEMMGQIALAVGGALLCVLLSDGIVDGLIKPLVERWRPSNDPLLKYTVQVVDGMRLKSFSFCSAHAANTLSIAVFCSLLVRSKVLSWTLILWSFINCWTRLYLGVHYPVDIVCGLGIGLVVGLVVYFLFYRLYIRISPKIKYISDQYTSAGYDYDDVDKVITVMMFILIYVVIKTTVLAGDM